MSETVQYRGILKKVPIEHDLETTCKELLKKEGCEWNETKDKKWCESPYEKVMYELSEKYVILNKSEIFEVVKNEDLGYDDLFEIKKVGDEYHYLVKFYNGGCGFGEAIEYALEKYHEKTE